MVGTLSVEAADKTIMNTLEQIAGQGAPSSPAAAPTRIAIVGCGAVTEKKHLPALRESTSLVVTALSDVDDARLQRVGNAFGIDRRFRHAAEIAGHADIAVVAVPHHLHADVSVELMKAGLHVFVEKPLATSMTDVKRMLDAARLYGRKIGVGLVRRQYETSKFVKRILDEGWLGAIRSFDYREGGAYNWPVATPPTFRKRTAGGVLFDTGAHSLDMVLYWLGDFDSVLYEDDSRGGVDANCRLDLMLKSGVTGTIELSRTRGLRNTCIIQGERGEIEIGVGPAGPVLLRVDGTELSASPRSDVGLPSPLALMRVQLEQFSTALTQGADCSLFAEHTSESIRLFDACKSSVRPMHLPWEAFRHPERLPALAGKRILVLGGTGFIGGRVVEVLADCTGANVRVLCRDFSKLSNLSRLDDAKVEVIAGDVVDTAALEAAMKDCDVVINCTFGKGSKQAAQEVNVDAVKTIVNAAARQGIRRVIHLSTLSAYGVLPEGTLEESDPRHAPKSFVYGYTKWLGEREGFAAAKAQNVEFAVIQPTVVYGPGAPSWTMNPLRMLRTGIVPLVNGGTGACNAVYVDDLVQAIAKAVVAEGVSGERFLVSARQATTWRNFYGAFERMLSRTATVDMPLDDLEQRIGKAEAAATNRAQVLAIFKDKALLRRVAGLPAIRALKEKLSRPTIERMKRVIYGAPQAPQSRSGPSGPPVHLLSRSDAAFQASTLRVSVDRAVRVLGYAPAYDLDEGMSRTAEWARWANLLD
jgi:predicted dehydrogenase/nucleoside-diphosphate-sugar epimerase